MSITTPHREHPLVAAVHTAGMALDEASGIDPLDASHTEQQTLLVQLTRLSTRVTARRAQILAVADDLALDSGARDVPLDLGHHGMVLPRHRIPGPNP
jgi:hypothetical protein